MLKFNLLPPEFKEEFLFAQKIKKAGPYLRMLLGLLVILSLFLLFISMYLQHLEYNLSGELNALQHDPSILALNRLKADLKTFNARLATIANAHHSPDWAGILIHLSTMPPPSVSLGKITIQQTSQGHRVLLEGHAKTRQDVISLEAALSASPVFSNIISPLSNYEKTDDITFQMSGDIINPPSQATQQ